MRTRKKIFEQYGIQMGEEPSGDEQVKKWLNSSYMSWKVPIC